MDDKTLLAVYTFGNIAKMPNDINNHLVADEDARYCYKSTRDIAVFTNKRILLSNAKGTTGKTAELVTIPYSSICFYSTENAGTIMNSYNILRIWTKVGEIRFNLSCDEKIGNIAKLLDKYLVK